MSFNPRDVLPSLTKDLQARWDDPPTALLVSRFGFDFLDPVMPEVSAWPAMDVAGLQTVPGLQAGRVALRQLDTRQILALEWEDRPSTPISASAEGLPIWAAARLRIPVALSITAGTSLDPETGPGGLFAVADHIRWDREDPLSGWPSEQEGARFPQLHGLYSPPLLERFESAGVRAGVAWIRRGPTGATLAEMAVARQLGADLLLEAGSSEAIAARHCGVQFGALAMTLTGAAADQRPDPAAIAERAERLLPQLADLLAQVLANPDHYLEEN